jgi:hypothetical protein
VVGDVCGGLFAQGSAVEVVRDVGFDHRGRDRAGDAEGVDRHCRSMRKYERGMLMVRCADALSAPRGIAWYKKMLGARKEEGKELYTTRRNMAP